MTELEKQLPSYSGRKPIPGYNGYEATRDGRIYSRKSKKYLKIQKKMGCYKYAVVILYFDGKPHSVPVHKLIALAWIEIPDKYGITKNEVLGNYFSRNLVVDHIDGDRYNNCVDNLRWCTSYENLNYENVGKIGARTGNKNAAGRKYNPSSKTRFRYQFGGESYTMKELCEKLDCSRSKITESFRRNLGLVRSGELTRTILKKEK